ncbi:MAG: thiol:disulfide interchange protein DsbA/DsbL [Methylococcales bacterium]|nr:thiol:disulfide interchange protein DsbA/DsbL [Methylococcales bacterium]MBT4598391.1 thiol:disulfide interchange protein DsbA/DsbL [Methylococcales bacterium]MBT4664804.1 thiol:disulfide interchange protein DsbA/DsbL [Methylococcales bacterium]
MVKLFRAVLWLVLGLSAQLLWAESAVEKGYENVAPVQPVELAGKVEVLEFFWYGCPHCFSFEPVLNEWVKKQSDKINFVRVPAVFSKRWGRHAKAYFTAQALGVSEQLHADFFNAIQIKKQRLETEDQLVEFFVAHGVNEQDFRNAYQSFLVDAKMRQAKSMGPRYGVTSVPTIIINGKYRSNASIAGGQAKMLGVMDQLVAEESKP